MNLIGDSLAQRESFLEQKAFNEWARPLRFGGRSEWE